MIVKLERIKCGILLQAGLTSLLPVCYTRKVHALEQELFNFVSHTYTLMGWPGVVVLMAIESACIPLPSEIIMPLAGWLFIKNQSLGPVYILVAGAYGGLGCTIGSVIAYWVGVWGGRPFLERYGKYVLVTRRDLALADRWFNKYGSRSIFLARLLPVIRTFISLPAGIVKMNFTNFVILTFLGSFIWCAGLAYGGYLLGEHWEQIRVIMSPFIPIIIAVIIVLVVLYIYRHVKQLKVYEK